MTEDTFKLLKKAEKFCAYQDRCKSEVVAKLKALEATPKVIQEILNHLREDGFICEERFVKSFVRGKMNQKHWGINKIRFALQQKGIDAKMIRDAINEIDSDTYRLELEKILKAKKINETDPFKRKAKLASYAIQKGYEPNLIWEVLNLSEE